MTSRSLSPLTFVGFGLLSVAALVYGLDSWRGSHRNGQIDYVLKHAKAVTTDGSSAIADGDLVVAVEVPMPKANVVDPDLAFNLDVLQYSRDAEIYQWRENVRENTVTNSDGSKRTDRTYSYSKVWTDSLVSSSSFHDTGYSNYGSFPFNDRTIRPDGYVFGSFDLDKSFAGLFPSAKKLAVTREMFDGMPEHFRRRFSIVDGGLFPDRSPQIGDIRVSFTAVMPQLSTVVGAYKGGIIVPAQTEAGEIAMLRPGNMSIEDLASQEKADNGRTSTILLVIACLLGVGGAACLFFGIKNSSSGRTRAAGI